MDSITAIMQKMYETYPYSNLSVNAGRIRGGWFLHYPYVYYSVFGRYPASAKPRILDAGCGGGDITTILAANNSAASITAIDLSAPSLAAAQDLAGKHSITNIEFQQKDIMECDFGEEFDFIVSSGVVHHLSDPQAGLVRLAKALKPAGIILLYVYSAYGRREIQLIREILDVLEPDKLDFSQRGRIVKKILQSLPADNALVRFFNSPQRRLNQQGSYFVDMYLNPNEHHYTLASLGKLLEGAGLKFVEFVERDFWDIRNHIKDSFLREKIQALSRQNQFRLIELIHPEIMGYSVFACRRDAPVQKEEYRREELFDLYPLLNPAAAVLDNRITVRLGRKTVGAAVLGDAFFSRCTGRDKLSQIIDKQDVINKKDPEIASLLFTLYRERMLLFLPSPRDI